MFNANTEPTMKPVSSLRTFSRRGVLALSLSCVAASAWAADDTPIRILVGFPPGGSTDVIARHLALGLQKELGRTVIVDNKSGAGGQLAAQALKAAKPDGTTLFLSNSHTVAMIPLTVLNPGFDPAKDFAPVGLVAIDPAVMAVSTAMVGPDVKNLRDFAQWAKTHTGNLGIGVPAPASSPEFAVTLIARATDVPFKAVPYRGAAPMVQDVVSGQVPAGIGAIGNALPFAKSGKLRIIAVDGAARLPSLPEVATFAEQGVKGIESVIFTGLYAPAGTPAPLIQTYNAAITKTVKSPDFIEKLAGIGATAASSTPAELGERVSGALKSWGEMVKAVGFKPQ